PNLHYQHLPLLAWQKIERGDECALGIVFSVECRLHGLIGVRKSSRFTASPTAVAAKKIERDGPDRCVKKSTIADVVISSPKLDERFLNNVFGIGRRSCPLPREQHKAGCELTKPSFPIFIGGDILHDLFT